MKVSRFVIVLALLSSFALQTEAKKVKLQYNFKEGDRFRYEVVSSQNIDQEINGQSTGTSISNSNTYDFQVMGVSPEGLFQMNASLVAFSTSAATPMGDMKYDSATDTLLPDFAKSMSVTLNEVYSFVLSPQGAVSEVVAPAGLVEKVDKILAELGGEQMQMFSGIPGMSASTESFKKVVEGFFMKFPKDNVSEKESWEEKTATNQMIAFNVISQFELVNAGKESTEIKVTAQILQDTDAPPMEIQGMTVNYEMLGAKAGTLLLDPESGLVLNSEMVSEITGTISIESPQLPSPMSIPMTMRSTDKITRK